MASGQGPTTLAHRSVASIRSAPIQGGPSSPQTPNTPPRGISSTFGSPSTMRAEEDILVVEIGSRYVRAGFAGDSAPKASLQCGSEQQRRVGDYRSWLPQTERRPGHAWTKENEIWRYDLRSIDLGLVHDKLDRLLREAFTKYLLIDSKPRRMALVLDSALPLPLLSATLDTLFERFQTPLVSLYSSATMAAVAAAVRSALVVNIGWSETVVTSVYEYREVRSSRSVRAGKHLLDGLYNKVLRVLITGEEHTGPDEEEHKERVVSFDETEDVLCRLAWCRSSASRDSQRDSAQLETVEEQDESEAEEGEAANPLTAPKKTTDVPLRTTVPPKTITISFDKLADVCDDTFFDQSTPTANFDDHELPVHTLVYRHLLQLPVDVRAICMSRIIFTGGCSNIPGLKQRILDEVDTIVERRGWEPASGKGVDALRSNPKLKRNSASSLRGGTPPATAAEDVEGQLAGLSLAANAEAVDDPVERKVNRHRKQQEPIKAELRALHSLGPWVGTSLMCQLKIPAMVNIDRDVWLYQGIHGASKPSEVDMKTQHRQSIAAGGLIRGSGHHSWTLGAWGATLGTKEPKPV